MSSTVDLTQSLSSSRSPVYGRFLAYHASRPLKTYLHLGTLVPHDPEPCSTCDRCNWFDEAINWSEDDTTHIHCGIIDRREQIVLHLSLRMTAKSDQLYLHHDNTALAHALRPDDDTLCGGMLRLTGLREGKIKGGGGYDMFPLHREDDEEYIGKGLVDLRAPESLVDVCEGTLHHLLSTHADVIRRELFNASRRAMVQSQWDGLRRSAVNGDGSGPDRQSIIDWVRSTELYPRSQESAAIASRGWHEL